jgi:(p)ppGpp synthase/HD superfamily hydrolase
MTNILVESALVFAARVHAGQKRKSSDIPYIVHPVCVMLLLMEHGEHDSELLTAALLHDTIEDTSVTLDQVRAEFGEGVAAIVAGCSEPAKHDHSWEERKRHTIATLPTAPRAVQLISAADKLHNLRSMVADHVTQGDALWSRFNRGRASSAWYYRSIAESLSQGPLHEHPLVRDLNDTVRQFFGEVAA